VTSFNKQRLEQVLCARLAVDFVVLLRYLLRYLLCYLLRYLLQLLTMILAAVTVALQVVGMLMQLTHLQQLQLEYPVYAACKSVVLFLELPLLVLELMMLIEMATFQPVLFDMQVIKLVVLVCGVYFNKFFYKRYSTVYV
jgi:hypothetical protein